MKLSFLLVFSFHSILLHLDWCREKKATEQIVRQRMSFDLAWFLDLVLQLWLGFNLENWNFFLFDPLSEWIFTKNRRFVLLSIESVCIVMLILKRNCTEKSEMVRIYSWNQQYLLNQFVIFTNEISTKNFKVLTQYRPDFQAVFMTKSRKTHIIFVCNVNLIEHCLFIFVCSDKLSDLQLRRLMCWNSYWIWWNAHAKDTLFE